MYSVWNNTPDAWIETYHLIFEVIDGCHLLENGWPIGHFINRLEVHRHILSTRGSWNFRSAGNRPLSKKIGSHPSWIIIISKSFTKEMNVMFNLCCVLLMLRDVYEDETHHRQLPLYLPSLQRPEQQLAASSVRSDDPWVSFNWSMKTTFVPIHSWILQPLTIDRRISTT